MWKYGPETIFVLTPCLKDVFCMPCVVSQMHFLCQTEDDNADCSAGGSDSAAPNRMEDEANYLQ